MSSVTLSWSSEVSGTPLKLYFTRTPFLKIRNTHRSARVVYDVWKKLSETPDNTASPISVAHINVKPGSV